MRAGVTASALRPPQPWRWTPEHLAVGAILRIDDPDWQASDANFVVAEHEGSKYVTHANSGGAFNRVYIARSTHREYTDTDVVVEVGGIGVYQIQGALVRSPDTYLGYAAWMERTALVISRADAGSSRTDLATTPLTHTVEAEKWSVRLQAIGDQLRAKAWRTSDPEPSEWMLTATDDMHASGMVGFAGRVRSSTPRAFWSIESRI